MYKKFTYRFISVLSNLSKCVNFIANILLKYHQIIILNYYNFPAFLVSIGYHIYHNIPPQYYLKIKPTFDCLFKSLLVFFSSSGNRCSFIQQKQRKCWNM